VAGGMSQTNDKSGLRIVLLETASIVVATEERVDSYKQLGNLIALEELLIEIDPTVFGIGNGLADDQGVVHRRRGYS